MSFRASASRPAFALAFASTLSLALASASFADSYHQVEPGETLSSIAARYSSSPETLRTFNKLSFQPEAALPQMLLRIPDTGNKTVRASHQQNPVQTAEPRGEGTIVRSVRYQVQAGDTLASIAARFSQDGNTVSASAIRERNRVGAEVPVGSVLQIPVSSAVYRSNAQTKSTGSGTTLGTTRVGAAEVSGEFEWPTADVVDSTEPMYRSPNVTPQMQSMQPQLRLASVDRSQRSPGTYSRGGSPRDYARNAPSSRGYSPGARGAQMRYGSQLDGARVLGSDESAPNTGTPSISGSRSRVVSAPVQAAPSGQKVARVAKVSLQGARIRRLPDAQAVSLYACPTSTEVAVTRQSGAWSAILMADHSTGWMPTRYLQFTGASLDISSIPVSQTNYSNLRRMGRRGIAISGNFSSSNPYVAAALGWLGTPYVYGGQGRRGIDCSSLVQHSFRDNGVQLPRTAAQQARVGRNVPPDQLQAGDRLYFSASGSRIDHTGIYMGDGLFVHASGSGRSVIVSNLQDSRNWNIFVCARR